MAFLFAKSQAALGKGETKPQPRPTQGVNPEWLFCGAKKPIVAGSQLIVIVPFKHLHAERHHAAYSPCGHGDNVFINSEHGNHSK